MNASTHFRQRLCGAGHFNILVGASGNELLIE